VTEPRPAIPFATLALSRRTVQRKALLAPWDKRVAQLWDYLVAWSAKKHAVMVSHTVLVLNHQHSVVTPKARNIADYERDVHGLFARGLNALLKEQGFEPVGQIWDNQQPVRMRLMDAAASISQHIYDRMQNVAAGFVDKPSLMPGYDFNREYWIPGRPLARKMPKIEGFSLSGWPEVTIQYQPEPALVAQFGGDIGALNRRLDELEKGATKKILSAADALGLKPRGAAAARRMHPFDEPQTAAKKRGPAPAFRIGAAGVSCPEKRKRSRHAWGERRAFVGQNSEARLAYKAGNKRVLFPYGTDKIVRDLNAQMKTQAEPDAYWMAPGPSLDEVYRELGLANPRDVEEVLLECAEAIEAEAGEFREATDADYSPRARTPDARSEHNRAPMRQPSITIDTGDGTKMDVGEADAALTRERSSSAEPTSGKSRSKRRRKRKARSTKRTRNTGRRASDPPSD